MKRDEPHAGELAQPGDRIGLDLGTTVLKGVRLRADGTQVAAAECPAAYNRPHDGWVETDPEAHWHAVADLIRQLVGAAPGDVAAVAACGASGNTLLTDADGRPLRPIINWMDQRCAGRPPPALAGLTAEAVRTVAGWACLDIFPLAHLGWLLEHEPETYRRAEHVGMNTDWLLFRLSGQWVMDASTATTFHLQDQTARRWHAPFLQRLHLRASQLSRLSGPGVPVGGMTDAAAAATGLPRRARMVTGCFDHPAAARAAGVREPGLLMLSCGTSWVAFLPWSDRQAIVDAGLLCDPFLSGTGGPWAGMLSVPAIGPVIDDYVRHVIAPGAETPLRVFDELAAQAQPGANNLRIDLRRPWQPQPGARPADVARAVMEGAARLLAERLRALESRGFIFRRAVVVGGPGRSPVWPSIIAAETGLELTVGPMHAGARGAALLAGEGCSMPAPPHGALAPSKTEPTA
jgi:sugar (pentulose or hexulose) kinase